MKKTLFLMLALELLSNCAQRKNTYPKNILSVTTNRLDADENCGGFLFKKISKIGKDSAVINISIFSCLDNQPIPFAWVKLSERSMKSVIKLTADNKGKISKTLPIGYYSVESTSIHYNSVNTPLLLFSNYQYQLNFYLGSGDPLID